MMTIVPSIKIASGALRTNKVRSALTMLGVIIGVAAVIATVAVGEGATERIQQQIASLGSNMIMLIPAASQLRESAWEAALLQSRSPRTTPAPSPPNVRLLAW